MTAAVSVRGLRHDYATRRGPRPALRGVDFDVAVGELFGVLGPNGGGKTTLFRILSTALRATGGEARLGGIDVAGAPSEARQRLGVVFQSPSLDKKLSVAENLRHQGRLYGLSGKALADRAAELLERLGVADRAGDAVETLSGGLQRRVEIAKSLLHRPSLLLLDEPTTGLDPGARRDVWTYLTRLKKEGVTVLVTTHLMEEADRCDRLAVLDKGRIAALGTPAALKDEIEGDVVRVTTDNPAGLAEEIRSRFGWTAVPEEGHVRLERSRGHEAIAQILGAFPDRATAASVSRPSLEDVFVRYTGHRFWADAPEEGSR